MQRSQTLQTSNFGRAFASAKSAYIGVDIGSISTKGVVIDANRNIIARSYLWTEGNPVEGAKRVIAELKDQLASTNSEGDQNQPLGGYKICGVGTTGSARRLVGAMLGACVVKNEITAHAVGTTHLHPDVRTILEIGGQDSKIILVEDGIATDYAMNTLCAAGTGSFLSSQAARLGVAVEDFGSIALTSKHPANIAARCTVFAESDLVHKIQVGYERQDIIAGLCRAVASNYLNNVGKGKKIASPVVFQGGVSKNIGVVAAFEDLLGCEVKVDPDGHLMGAFGVALLAADEVETGTASPDWDFDFDAVANFEFVTREIECAKCSNKCEIICVYRDGKIIDSWGNRCEKGAVATSS
jgi:predicted CoA-substrate-specific enzyme activase